MANGYPAHTVSQVAPNVYGQSKPVADPLEAKRSALDMTKSNGEGEKLYILCHKYQFGAVLKLILMLSNLNLYLAKIVYMLIVTKHWPVVKFTSLYLCHHSNP